MVARWNVISTKVKIKEIADYCDTEILPLGRCQL
jgi:hypothetical protein